jgi:hypothetical protein
MCQATVQPRAEADRSKAEPEAAAAVPEDWVLPYAEEAADAGPAPLAEWQKWLDLIA